VPDTGADFGMDALFTAYGDGIITKTSVAWNGYIREVPINTKDFPAADVLVRKAENSLVGIGWGYRFVAVLAGCPYES
jgi:hypothetical protein